MSDVSRILEALGQDGSRPAEELLPLVYDELRRLAAQKLALEKPGQTLQATALVHEAYLRLVGTEDPGWRGRGHFFAAAAGAMRRILIERARQKAATKHGGGRERIDPDLISLSSPAPDADPVDLLALDAALTRLASEDPEKADLVELRYFAGLSLEDTAAVLEISPATAKRRWAFARAWLLREIEGTRSR